jgi:hypothetical protein
MNIGQEQMAETSRKPGREYAAPRLTSYGSLADLTRGGSFVGNDGNTMCTGSANASGDKPCIS